jgi:hypothetical protein
LRADLADAQQGTGLRARLRAAKIQAELLMGSGGDALKERFSSVGQFARWLSAEARGRPRSLARALLRGSFAQRIANTEKYLQGLKVRQTHRAWNSFWKRTGLQSFKPKWSAVKGPARALGTVVGRALSAAEIMSELRSHRYSAAAGTLGAVVLTKPAVLLDVGTGGSVTGYVEIFFETPSAVLHGDQGISDISDRMARGEYGPLPKWEAKLGDKLGGFLYDRFSGH